MSESQEDADHRQMMEERREECENLDPEQPQALKPCPFCGSDAMMFCFKDNFCCKKNGCIAHGIEGITAEMWNKRAGSEHASGASLQEWTAKPFSPVSIDCTELYCGDVLICSDLIEPDAKAIADAHNATLSLPEPSEERDLIL